MGAMNISVHNIQRITIGKARYIDKEDPKGGFFVRDVVIALVDDENYKVTLFSDRGVDEEGDEFDLTIHAKEET